MHTHLPKSVVETTDGEGIVEVLGIVGVDGAGEHLAEVFAFGQILGGNLATDLVGGILHVLRVFIGQAVLGEDGMHLRIVLAEFSEDIHHLARHVLVVGIGPVGDFHHRLVIGLASLELRLGDDDVVSHDIVGRDEQGKILVDTELAHKLVAGSLKDGGHHGLLDMLLAAGHERHLHTVAVERRHRVAFGHKHGLAAIVRNERVLAVGLAPERAFLHLGLGIEPVGVVARAGEEVIPGHLLQQLKSEHLHGMGHEFEFLEYLAGIVAIVGILIEESYKRVADVLLRHALSSFFLCHSCMIYLFLQTYNIFSKCAFIWMSNMFKAYKL